MASLPMIAALLMCRALAHEGEDHAAPPAPSVSVDATATRVSASSAAFEAVWRIPLSRPGDSATSTLLLADFASSAPVADATLSATLAGPATFTTTFVPGAAPGIYTAPTTFPAAGDYAGALVVTTPTAADLLPLMGVHIDDPTTVAAAGPSVVVVVGGLVALLVVAGVALGVGYLLGRRRGAALVVALMALGGGVGRVSAGGGHDHGGDAAARSAGGGLQMMMESQFLVGLRTLPLAQQSFQERVPALGKFVARPGASATLRAPVPGQVAAPPSGFPAPGAAVAAGDVLAIVRESSSGADRATLAREREGAATAVAEAKKEIALAERDVAQFVALGEAISVRERLERQQSLVVARAALSAAERALDTIGESTNLAIRAPVSGRLGAVLVRPGDEVEAGQPLFRVVDAAGIWVEARLPERFAAGLVAGASAEVAAPAHPGVMLTAVVLDAGQEADAATGTFTITLAVNAHGLDLRPGMSATAWIARGAVREALVVPDAAIVDSNGFTLAFVKVSPEQFELREVRLGARSGSTWEVLTGLVAGERVVVDGTYPLRSLAGR